MSLLLRSRASFVCPSRSKLPYAYLQLPPSCRAFHASPRPQFLETVVTPAHTLFEGLHLLTGLPWAYTIPLAALTIRTVVVLPLNIYARSINRKQIALAPLIESWKPQLKREAMQEVGHLGPVVVTSTLMKKVRRKMKEVYSRWGCETWRNYAHFLQLPVFLIAIEALRMMCGTHEGLLGLIVAGISGGEATTEASNLKAWLEPGFATGGALWFPDLTVADPELRLPFMLSGSLLYNFVSWKDKNPTIWQTRLRRSLGLVALAAGPLTFQVPSAILLYWISSSLIAHGQNFLLDRFMPVKPFSPCKPKKPLRIGPAMLEKIR